MKPATPLPWKSAGHFVAMEKDAAYIVHAANAYPGLIKTLLLIASKEAVKPDVAAATILRELGEMS